MKNSTPLISVLMPAYNAEEYIAEAIESILGQTFKDFEFIIVDDCSTDKTWNIIQKYAKGDKRIRPLKNKTNLNIGATLNKAIDHSRSDLLARMDSDDISLEHRLEAQYNFMKRHPNVAVVGGDIILMDKYGNDLHIRKYENDSMKMKRNIFRHLPFAHPVTMYRKKIVQEFNGYDKKRSPSEDMDLWIKIGTKYDFGSIPDRIFKYRTFENSSSNKKLRHVEFNTLKMRWIAFYKYGYIPSVMDIFYNLAQLSTMYLMPAKFRIKLFNFLRYRNII